MFEGADKKQAIAAAKAAAMEHPKFWAEAAKRTTPRAALKQASREAEERTETEKQARLDKQAEEMLAKQRAEEGYWQTQAMEGIVEAGLIGRTDWEQSLRDDYAARRKEKAWDGAFLTERNGVDGDTMFCLC